MQNDEAIWQVIRHHHCSFMKKIVTGNFCDNPYNVTGTCNRSSCPLANSRYATVRDHHGVFYLYMKTIERAHKPNGLWERIKLPRNYEKALEFIDKNLQYWPKFLVHKTKQRLTVLTQCRIRMRRYQLKVREKVMTVPRKEKKREARREEKAEKAANLTLSTEKELVERLRKGVYDDIYNYSLQEFNKVHNLEELEPLAEEEEDHLVEYVEGCFEEEEDMEDFGGFVKDNAFVGNDDHYDEDDGHEQTSRKKIKGFGAETKKNKRKETLLVEVEHEDIGKVKRHYKKC